MEIEAYTLATLKRGQKGVISAIDASDPQVQRLMMLGLVEGTEIEHASAAIGGDRNDDQAPRSVSRHQATNN